MAERFLYEELNTLSEYNQLYKDIPAVVTDNLNPAFELRPYQKEAFVRFFHCFTKGFPGIEKPLHLLFNMATGSGKTLIMAGLILYLYEQGYRNFLFFVNATNIIDKTKQNFLNASSSKYLFNKTIFFGTKHVSVTPVTTFEGVNENDINIYFTTIQNLQNYLNTDKENAVTLEDFRNKKIVLLADEGHHLNASTKNGEELFTSWEDTVRSVFGQNEDNLLLEFTATLDYAHKNLVDKYRRKVLYRYDLRNFRNSGYSKDVYIVRSEFEEKDRIIQALILNQYKQAVAVKHGINLKPVILFKAQKTIEQSKQNKARFHKIIQNLSDEEISRIQEMSDLPLVKRAFQFFQESRIAPWQLAERLRREFDESRCISVNEKDEKENQQILLNTLEDSDNRVRAIFAVQKLNEGWDVLNLFDIVRCYTTRDGKAGKPGKTTIAEAQLIGRGARYFPFVTKDDNDPFRRKFDKDLTAELRVLEELHYHSLNDSKYISELHTALVEEGMRDERTVEKTLKLKESFRTSPFYERGLVYRNQRVKNGCEYVSSFDDLGVSLRNYHYSPPTGRGVSEAILDSDAEFEQIAEPKQKSIPIIDIPRHIVRKAIARNRFFSFKSLKRYFPRIQSVRQFIEADEYLAGLSITFQDDNLYPLSGRACLDAVAGLLDRIASELRKNVPEYRGTEIFKPLHINTVFTEKTLKLVEGTERADGDKQFVNNKDWYVFDANYGTSEEKAFVRMLNAKIDALKENHDGIYLVRNERHFKIYSFCDGQAFEPDFVLFLRAKIGEMLTYQIFIEPKGTHLQEHERWKEDFLKQIKEKSSGKLLEFQTKKYQVVGVPFYNNENENEFWATLESVL